MSRPSLNYNLKKDDKLPKTCLTNSIIDVTNEKFESWPLAAWAEGVACPEPFWFRACPEGETAGTGLNCSCLKVTEGELLPFCSILSSNLPGPVLSSFLVCPLTVTSTDWRISTLPPVTTPVSTVALALEERALLGKSTINTKIASNFLINIWSVHSQWQSEQISFILPKEWSRLNFVPTRKHRPKLVL